MLPLQTLINSPSGYTYRIDALIAEGGQGAVYRALHLKSQTFRAIKEMGIKGVDSKDMAMTVAAFHQEAALLEQLHHPWLPGFYEHFEHAGRQYMVTELIEGETMGALLAASGKLGPKDVLKWAVELCEVLIYLHSQDPLIVYRDMKPDNIMIDRATNSIRLIDFGIARRYDVGKSGDTRLLGTQGYAPPEQYGKRQSDVRSDIYALGVTLHELLTGIDPGQTPWKFDPIPDHNPDTPQALVEVVEKATRLIPERRFQSVAEMYKALTGRAAPEPLATFDPGAGNVLKEQAQNGWVKAIALTLFFFACLVALGFILFW